VYVESVLEVPEERVHCEACRVVGWAFHPVSHAAVHFILPADTPLAPGQCAVCGAVAGGAEGGRGAAACDACGTPLAERSPSVFDVTRHRLHGLIHSNGFGHLLRICGKEAGSSVRSPERCRALQTPAS